MLYIIYYRLYIIHIYIITLQNSPKQIKIVAIVMHYHTFWLGKWWSSRWHFGVMTILGTNLNGDMTKWTKMNCATISLNRSFGKESLALELQQQWGRQRVEERSWKSVDFRLAVGVQASHWLTIWLHTSCCIMLHLL